MWLLGKSNVEALNVMLNSLENCGILAGFLFFYIYFFYYFFFLYTELTGHKIMTCYLHTDLVL